MAPRQRRLPGLYAAEMSWREDNRLLPNGARYEKIAGLAMRRGPSVDLCGYWQRHIKRAA